MMAFGCQSKTPKNSTLLDSNQKIKKADTLFYDKQEAETPGLGSKNLEYVYWENLTAKEQNEILGSSHVYKDAINYYKRKLILSDNPKTFNLIDTLISSKNKNKKVDAFYFFLFNQICKESDGALSEGLGDHCQRSILKAPSFVITYFSKNKEILLKYAQFLGYEFYFKEKGTSTLEYNYVTFKKLLLKKTGNEEKNKVVLKTFFNEIEKAMKNMN